MCHVGRVGVSPPATKTEAGLAGLRRESRTGGHLARDLARSNEETKPRRMVWSVGRGGDRNCVGDEWRRRWGSGPRRDRRCSACFGERRSWARSTALQELVGATSSSGGARWRALRRQWRTAELGLRASWLRRKARREERKGGREELTGRLRKACDSLGAQRWPEMTAVTGDRGERGLLDPLPVVAPGSRSRTGTG